MMKTGQFVNPYHNEDAFHTAAINLQLKIYNITIKQLKSMNMSPTAELAYFGRTSEEWEKQLKRIK